MAMDNRFYRPHWSQSAMPSRYHINNGEIPIHSAQPCVQNHKPQARATPKVVQIPVRFVDSEPSRPDSALKIQKVFRGFLIRRIVKKIIMYKRDADEIAQRISRSDIVELIRRDQRERLRINEMLMALLFKLDLIRGFDAGVRDCRKAVVKKVISLQDRVDAIVSSETNQIQSESSVELEKHETNEEVIDSGSSIELEKNFETSKEKDDEFHDAIDSVEESNAGKESEEIGDMSDMLGEESNLAKEKGEVLNMTPALSECMEMDVHSTEKTMEESGGEKKESGTENMNINHQLVLQRLMEDNQTMMNMMTQLFERNEMQTQMLNTLRNKVEQLEKAFVCGDRTRKKKKKRQSS